MKPIKPFNPIKPIKDERHVQQVQHERPTDAARAKEVHVAAQPVHGVAPVVDARRADHGKEQGARVTRAC